MPNNNRKKTAGKLSPIKEETSSSSSVSSLTKRMQKLTLNEAKKRKNRSRSRSPDTRKGTSKKR